MAFEKKFLLNDLCIQPQLLEVFPSFVFVFVCKWTTLCSSGIWSTSQRSTWRRITCETGWGLWHLIRKAMSCATSRSVKMMKSLMLMNERWWVYLRPASNAGLFGCLFRNKRIHTKIEFLVCFCCGKWLVMGLIIKSRWDESKKVAGLW